MGKFNFLMIPKSLITLDPLLLPPFKVMNTRIGKSVLHECKIEKWIFRSIQSDSSDPVSSFNVDLLNERKDGKSLKSIVT